MKARLILAGLCLGILAAVLLREFATDTAPREETARPSMLEGSQPLTGMPNRRTDLQADPEGRAVRAALPTPASRGQVAATTPARGVGIVRFEVADPIHGALQVPFTVRFMSAARYGECWSRSKVQVGLSAGVYETTISAEGYEPLVLPEVEVRPAETNDLGMLWMNGGSGSIEGVVLAPHLPPEEIFRIELRGHGRRPCDTCREGSRRGKKQQQGRPACCGYTKQGTHRTLDGNRHFIFDGLAAGTYYLICRCSSLRHPDIREVVLGPQERTWIEISPVPEVALALHLLGETGAPFFARSDRGAGEEHSGEVEIEEEEEVEEEGMLGFEVRAGEHIVARADVQVYLDLDVIDTEYSDMLEDQGREAGAPIDRPRFRSDALVPVFPRPSGAIRPEVTGHDANNWTLTPLPAIALSIEVAYDSHTSGRVPIDLRFAPRGSFPIVMKAREED